MRNIKQQFIDTLLEKVREKALKQPDTLMLFVAESMAFLAMQKLSDEELTLFERAAYSIIDTYTKPAMLDSAVIRDNRHIH